MERIREWNCKEEEFLKGSRGGRVMVAVEEVTEREGRERRGGECEEK